MATLPVGLLFLSAFVNNTLFIHVDPSVRDTFICLSINNQSNDSWPSAWKRMDLNYGLFTYKIDDNIINNSTVLDYKLRLYYSNKPHVITDKWIQLYNKTQIKECNINVCIILLIVFFLLFICSIGYILIKAYMYYK